MNKTTLSLLLTSSLIVTGVFAQTGQVPPNPSMGQVPPPPPQGMRREFREERREDRKEFRGDMKEARMDLREGIKERKEFMASTTASGTAPTPWKDYKKEVKDMRKDFREDRKEDMKKFIGAGFLQNATATAMLAQKLGTTTDAIKQMAANGTLHLFMKSRAGTDDLGRLIPKNILGNTNINWATNTPVTVTITQGSTTFSTTTMPNPPRATGTNQIPPKPRNIWSRFFGR